ncbi:4-coumarate-CoA ligase [Exophiala viscosa]|uniref:4-coumarate-CoA ligase n=1 Tax=Exophiala viscosa TaxID=2486360 RepID=A0AAN6DSY1_9EURO|nr:4-coumarate-CoA ligase [Exophiala viscosa]
MTIFNSDYQIDIPKQDILTFLFTKTPFKNNDPIWLDAINPKLNVTLAKAKELTQRIGQGLRDLGIGSKDGSEDIVLSYIENQVMVAPTTFGVLCASGIHATCPMTATAFELARQIKLSGPKILICSPQTRKVAEEAISQAGNNNIKLLVMMSESLDIVDASGKSIISDKHLQWRRMTDPSVLENTTACLVYSSGTTGVPKGVRITQSNIVANLCQMAYHFDHFAGKAIAEGEYLRMPGIMQNAVVLGITVQTMMALQCGIQVYMFKKFDFDYLIQCIRTYKFSTFFMVPAVWNRISNECSKEDLASSRFCMSGASPLPLPLQLKVQEMLPEGVMLRVNWGMTETTTGAAQPAPTEVDTEGSSGRLLPNLQAVILGGNGETLGVNEDGELCVKGPNIIREYFKNPEATKSAFTPEGWFRTGDVAHFSEDGKLFIVGRSKELLKYKSHQISPTELEGVLGLFPGIADVGIIGVPDGNANDLPRAYVVISQTSQPGSVTEKDIHEFLNPKVSSYKRLRAGIAFVKEIPRNHNGKIMRNVLKEWAEKDVQNNGRAKL